MNYEKAYKEALERAKAWKENRCMPTDTNRQGVLEDIFPELKESEDERIRKWLEETIESMSDNNIIFKDVRRIDVLHWLEKQANQKPKWTDEISFISQEGKDERIMWLNKLDERFANQEIAIGFNHLKKQ